MVRSSLQGGLAGWGQRPNLGPFLREAKGIQFAVQLLTRLGVSSAGSSKLPPANFHLVLKTSGEGLRHE